MGKGKYEGKYATVMREYKAGTLGHGSTGEIVRRDDVAKAIAHSEATKASKGKKRKKKRRGRLGRVLKKHYGTEEE